MTTDRSTVVGPVVAAAGASAAAGLLHVAAVGAHREVASLALVFAIAASLQIGWAVVAVLRPSTAVLLGGAAVNASLVIAWAMTSTVGFPVIAALEQPTPVGLSDLAAAALASIAAMVALVGWLGLELPSWAGTTPASAFAVVVIVASVAAVPAVAADAPDLAPRSDTAHDHAPAPPPGHDHAPPLDHDVAAHDPAPPPDISAYDPDDPVVSLDDPRLSEGQRAAAQALVDDVRSEMARFTDAASVEAEGYVSIGDGITGYEHFSHPVLREDDITLDPSRPESIVFRVAPDGSRELVSAMFIMPPGSTMDDVPDIAGSLTTWHDHQDLCWSGFQVVATTGPDGTCPRGEFRVGQPMLHVWLVPHECGPFAGLEGHGGDCRQHAH